MAANSEFYPYENDETLGYQLSTKTLYQLKDQHGNKLEPSIFLGSSDALRTKMIGMGWHKEDMNTLKYQHTESVTFPASRFGLCDSTSQFNTGGYRINYDAYFPIKPSRADDEPWGVYRKSYNNNRWATGKESVDSGYYRYHPVVKMKKGCCVGYLNIKAWKEVPLEFANTNALSAWRNDQFNGNYEQYLLHKDEYPNIHEIGLTFKATSTVGGSNRTKTLYLFFEAKAPMTDGECGGAYDGGFSYYVPNGMAHAGAYDNGGPIPKGSEHIAYPSVDLIFKGGISSFGIAPPTLLALQDVENFGNWYVQHGVGNIRVAQSQYLNDGGTYPLTFIFFDGNIEELFKDFTNLGFAMTTQGNNKATTGDIKTDPSIYVPTYDNRGNVTGNSNSEEDGEKYVEGGENGEDTQPNFDPYAGGGGGGADEGDEPTPEEDPSEEQKTDTINMPNVALTSYGVFNKTYVMSKQNLQALSDYLWNGDPTTWDTIIEDLKLVGDNRMNSIINVIMFPFPIPNDDGVHRIRIGRHNTDVSAAYLDDSQNIVFEMGRCFCTPKHGNFLDYEPYTKLWLYIPFVGVFSVPTQQFMNKWIRIKLVVDVLTGSGEAVVFADNIPVLYKNCKIGMQIPVTGSDSGYVIRNYLDAIKGGANAISGYASNNVMGMLGGAFQAATSALAAQGAPIQSEGSASPQCGMLMPNKCYFIIEYPKTIMSQNPDYGHLIGYACRKTGQIGNFSGFSKFENVTLNISHCTDAERNEIISLLKAGVYVN
jgi:hypothetical protein